MRGLVANEFDREHVLSKAFGSFEHAPVLHRCVCKECNRFFGDHHELQFARGAIEGLLRYQHDIKKPPDGSVRSPYVELTIPDGNGDWSGTRLILLSGKDGLYVELSPQAAFFDQKRGKWLHATLDDLRRGFLSKRPDLKKGQIKIFARSPDEYREVVSKLGECGVNYQPAGELKRPAGLLNTSSLEVEITFTINQSIRRCIAKYAFNYLAYVSGGEFARLATFNVIRQFVRYGNPAPFPLVVETATPILYDDQPTARQTNGHLLTLSWAASNIDLVGQVSLFNSVTYHVSLCRHFGGALWRPIREGIHYDIESRAVKPLKGLSKSFAPY